MAPFILAILSLMSLFVSPAFSENKPDPSGIKSWCAQTPHPRTCKRFFLNNPKYSYPIKGKADFYQKSLYIAIERAMQAMVETYHLGSKLRNEREKAAWKDCLEVYDIAIQHLNETLNPSTKLSEADSQTKLSTALTYVATCKQGFDELGSANYMTPMMPTDVDSLISNTLALNEKVPNSVPVQKNGFPNWVRPRDRKLLQAPTPTIPCNFIVAKDGSSNYTTVNAAVTAASKITDPGRKVICIKKGMYVENVVIGKKVKNIMFVGDGIGQTIIAGSRSVGGTGSTTFNSATVGVIGEGFIVRGVTFRNMAGPQNHQAVAFRSGSDLSVYYQCTFEGYQDTLYVHSNRQFYRNCQIYGTVDFIFGNAAAVFQNCDIYARNAPNKINTVTAHGRTDPNQNTGIVIQNSRVLAAPDLVPVLGSVRTYLGRPWQKFSRTVFMKTFLDNLVASAGWFPWNGQFALDTLYYGEYANTGPGSVTSGRVNWKGYHLITSVAEASQFTATSFIGGDSWVPKTGVPYYSGL